MILFPQVDAIYLDFHNAFDFVPHNELLVKLWSIGVTESLWLWFVCYLKDRFQCVVVNGQCSDLLPVISAVPQGSILGPLLFLIYINDLPSAIKFAKAFLFADDTKCYKRITDTIDIHHLQEDINCISSWSIRDNLLLNLSKCIFMQFNSSQHTSYHINNSTLLPVTSHKDLGVIFSSDLKWNHHYEYIIAKYFKILGLLCRHLSSNSCITTKNSLHISSEILFTLLFTSLEASARIEGIRGYTKYTLLKFC